MTSKTHYTIGVSAALLCMQPTNLSQLAMALVVTGIGAEIPDIDVKNEKADRNIRYVLAFLGGSMAGYAIYRFWLGMPGIAWIRMILGMLFFEGICLYGKRFPHRYFMHSLLCMVALTVSTILIEPKMGSYFLIGIVSHLLADMMNYREVKLFFPYEKGISFHWFYAKSKEDTIIFVTTLLLLIAVTVYVLFQI